MLLLLLLLLAVVCGGGGGGGGGDGSGDGGGGGGGGAVVVAVWRRWCVGVAVGAGVAAAGAVAAVAVALVAVVIDGGGGACVSRLRVCWLEFDGRMWVAASKDAGPRHTAEAGGFGWNPLQLEVTHCWFVFRNNRGKMIEFVPCAAA